MLSIKKGFISQQKKYILSKACKLNCHSLKIIQEIQYFLFWLVIILSFFVKSEFMVALNVRVKTLDPFSLEIHQSFFTKD